MIENQAEKTMDSGMETDVGALKGYSGIRRVKK